jgi:hypothetical protein
VHLVVQPHDVTDQRSQRFSPVLHRGEPFLEYRPFLMPSQTLKDHRNGPNRKRAIRCAYHLTLITHFLPLPPPLASSNFEQSSNLKTLRFISSHSITPVAKPQIPRKKQAVVCAKVCLSTFPQLSYPTDKLTCGLPWGFCHRHPRAHP